MAGVDLRSVERQQLLDGYGRWLWVLKQMPWHLAHSLTGIALPPHERLWLRNVFAGYKQNDVVASRGTSKSFSHASLAAPLLALVSKNLKIVSVSAPGFRVGKMLMDDAEKLWNGNLSDQRLPGPFLMASSKDGQKTVKREPDKWTMEFKSGSFVRTMPSNNADALRGTRAHIIFVDERNTFDGVVVEQVIRPFQNVGQAFRKAANAGDGNRLYQVSTIDYSIRDWAKALDSLRQSAEKEYLAQQARKMGDWDEYNRLRREDSGALEALSLSYSRIDYTDLLIPQEVDAFDGARYRVNYPVDKGLEEKDVLRFDAREQKSYWYSYPVDRAGLEAPLLAGTVDEEIWLAEQRNVFIAAAGNVFPYQLVQRAAEQPIPGIRLPADADEGKGKGYEEFYAPVLFRCGDPCVLAVDPASESDHAAFCVVRLGFLAKEKFDPTQARYPTRVDKKGRVLLGQTTWSNICWAESHQHMDSRMIADKIRELAERYNIVCVTGAPGIAMDKGGGGTAVRADLAKPSRPSLPDGTEDMDWVMPPRYYDPEDEEYAYLAAQDDPAKVRPWLTLLKPTNERNHAWVSGAKGLLETRQLYIGYYLPPSKWARIHGLINALGEPDETHPDFVKLRAGYDGVRRLKMQLLRVQTKTSDNMTTRYVMPGKRDAEEGKKDLFSTTIYAASLVHAHLAASEKNVDEDEPIAFAIMTEIPGRRTY